MKTITDQDVRIFRSRVFLGDLLRQYAGAIVDVETPVPVYSPDNRLLGHAHVSEIAGRLYADVEIDYHCEERLLAETGEPLWLWIVGELQRTEPYVYGLAANGSAGIDLTAPLAVDQISIEELCISREPPHDRKVGRFGVTS